jgi:hypothetical protein
MTTTKPQFGLSDLLWFAIPFGAYASEMAYYFDRSWNQDWRTPATILVTWIILAVFYLGNDLRALFAVHCLGLGSYFSLSMILLPEQSSFFAKFYTGCLLGNQISFPIFLLVLLVRLFNFFRRYLQGYYR